jgi:hypothetical protein
MGIAQLVVVVGPEHRAVACVLAYEEREVRPARVSRNSRIFDIASGVRPTPDIRLAASTGWLLRRSR